MRWATAEEIARWDELVSGNPDGGHILQSRTWGAFKGRHGWRPAHVLYDDVPGAAGPLAVLWLRRAFPGFGEMWYSPKGPGVVSPEQLHAVAGQRALFSGAFLARMDPELSADAAWQGAGVVKAFVEIQINPATIVVDLDRDEDALLASFHHKTRYNIRLAAKKGVTVEAVATTDETVDAMYELFRVTGERAGFPVRAKEYFADYWGAQSAAGQGQLFFARHEGDVLAGAFVTLLGHRGWYKDGGSVKHKSNLMAPHLLQWEIMRWLRERGVQSYDLVAVPRASELDAAHPLYGLWRFKSGFNEHITEFPGTVDLPLSGARYRAWTVAGERLASQWAQRVRHELVY